jgi:TRAP-type C4-dicarboxylate transport system permease small subunit
MVARGKEMTMRLLEQAVQQVAWKLAQIGQVATAVVMFLLVANIFSRFLWKLPVPGTVELTEMLGTVLLAGGVAYCHWVKGHISVGVLVERLSPRGQGLVDTLMNLLALAATGVLAKETLAFGLSMAREGYKTADLHVPMYPFIYLVGVCFLVLAIIIVRDLIKAVIMLVKGSENR